MTLINAEPTPFIRFKTLTMIIIILLVFIYLLQLMLLDVLILEQNSNPVKCTLFKSKADILLFLIPFVPLCVALINFMVELRRDFKIVKKIWKSLK